MSKQTYFNAIATWSEKFINSDKYYVSPTSIRIKTNGNDDFLSATFGVIVTFDLRDFANNENLPHWAIEETKENYGNVIAIHSPIKIANDLALEYVKVPSLKLFKRYYEIGVPFELTPPNANEQQIWAITKALNVTRIAYTEALQYLEQDKTQTNEGARFEVSAWSNFPFLPPEV